jgi:hypothetical protein
MDAYVPPHRPQSDTGPNTTSLPLKSRGPRRSCVPIGIRPARVFFPQANQSPPGSADAAKRTDKTSPVSAIRGCAYAFDNLEGLRSSKPANRM